jgi:hypothetical protein
MFSYIRLTQIIFEAINEGLISKQLCFYYVSMSLSLHKLMMWPLHCEIEVHNALSITIYLFQYPFLGNISHFCCTRKFCMPYLQRNKILLPSSSPHPFPAATSNRKHFPWSCIKKCTRSTNDLNCVMVLIFCISCKCCFIMPKKTLKRLKYSGCFIFQDTLFWHTLNCPCLYVYVLLPFIIFLNNVS